jgi:hypothetical protein
MNLGYDRPLYVQPFDHRGSFQTKLFGWSGKLSEEQTARIATSKRVIYDGLKQAIAEGAPPLVGWRDNKTSREAAVNEIARRYRQLVDVFEKARIA